MGLATAELYNNLGLCCFYAQQYDMTITCLQRALHIAEDQETLAEETCRGAMSWSRRVWRTFLSTQTAETSCLSSPDTFNTCK